MKKLIIFTIMAAMAITSLTACGNNKTTSTSNSAAATSDEAVVEEATIATLAETDQAVVDSGLTVDDKGNVVDKDGNKVETNAEGKVEVKTADGKTKTVSAAEVKTANDNKTKIDAANQAPQQTNSRNNSDNATSNSGSSTQTSQSSKSTQSSQTSKAAQSSQSSQSSQTSRTSQTSQSQQSSKTQATTADPHAGKTYHDAVYKTVTHPAETKQVKVVDKEAYTYEEPVYEMKRIAKCKDCGIDLAQLGSQEARDAHAEAHMEAGGDGGWYSTTEQVQVGTKTVTVPEQSHMETVIVKEAWTEQVLVKAAGWY